MAKLFPAKQPREDAMSNVSANNGERHINITTRRLREHSRSLLSGVRRRENSLNESQDVTRNKNAAHNTVNAAKLFGEDFLWGASTAGHQVEGGNYDQWTVWELAHAKELASTAEKRLAWLSNWDKIKFQAENPDNYVSGKGVDHFHRYREDFDILKSLNLNAFRFSIEWSRLEPEEGVWDKTAFDHYLNYISELKERSIEPILNLWHWTAPVWFDEKGGFTKSGNIGYFLRFAQKVAEEFGDEVKYIITLNEPNVYTSLSYLTGEWPPQIKSPLMALMVYRNLVKTHKYTYSILKKYNPDLQVGIAANMSNALPKDGKNILSKIVARAANYGWNWYFVNRIKRRQDFIGFNYYMTHYYDGFKTVDPEKPVNDLGWYMEPSGVGEIATRLWIKYHKPIMITENGVADADDQYRQWWLKETMLSLITSRKAGVKLIGYLHWSLLDNFEWAYGWWPKFGLVHVDRENNMKRTIRPSAKWWAAQIKKLQSDD
jgi:beta-glucosidase